VLQHHGHMRHSGACCRWPAGDRQVVGVVSMTHSPFWPGKKVQAAKSSPCAWHQLAETYLFTTSSLPHYYLLTACCIFAPFSPVLFKRSELGRKTTRTHRCLFPSGPSEVSRDSCLEGHDHIPPCPSGVMGVGQAQRERRCLTQDKSLCLQADNTAFTSV
jgi:hypothetical protein